MGKGGKERRNIFVVDRGFGISFGGFVSGESI